MARIELARVAHRYGGRRHPQQDYALRQMDMTWEDGSAYALLGPSGSGKTTLLNIISGLLVPSEGRVLLDGRDVTRVPTAERNIAQVFQFPVVYDTMSVYDNLAFPLRNRGVPEAEVRKRVLAVAGVLGLEAELPRRAHNLGADAKQKISMGRGLVRNDVAAILFDEPLTVIDPQLKWTLRRKLKEIHQDRRLTLIYVTHDQAEALTFADRVVVLHEGRAVQVGTPTELFEDPAHTFVGHFIGSPGMNLLPCTVADGAVQLGEGLSLALDPARAASAAAGGPLTLGIRPEFVGYRRGEGPDRLPVEVTRVEDLGSYRILTARMGAHRVLAKVRGGGALATGPAWFEFPRRWVRLYREDVVLR